MLNLFEVNNKETKTTSADLEHIERVNVVFLMKTLNRWLPVRSQDMSEMEVEIYFQFVKQSF